MKYLVLSIFLFFLISTSEILQAQWAPTNGPYGGGNITCLAVSGNILIAGTDDDSIYISMDSGLNWKQSNNGLPSYDYNICAITVIGTNIFVAASCGIYLSTDYGTNWKLVGLEYDWVYSLVHIGNNIFAGSFYNGVYISKDNGTTWVQVNNGLTNTSINSLFVNDTNIYASTSKGLFLSTNNGSNWSQKGMNNHCISCFAADGENMYAGTTDSGVFHSTDNGANWNHVNNGIEYKCVRTLLCIGTCIYAGTTYDGAYRSSDNGTSWTPVNNCLNGYTINNFAFSGTNIFACTYSHGVLLSTNDGKSWEQIGVSNTTISSLAVNGSNLFAGTTHGYIFRSTNNGTKWTLVNDGLNTGYIGCFTSRDSTLFAGTSNGVFISTDEGINWSLFGLSGLNVSSLLFNGSNIFAGVTSGESGSGVYRSTDNGSTWKIVNPGFTFSLIANGGSIFAGVCDAYGVFRSTNNGTTWESCNYINECVFSLATIGNNIFAGTLNCGVFLSTDNGTTWNFINNGLTNLMIGTLDVIGTNIFAETGNGVYISTNKGTNWIAVNEGLNGNAICSMTGNGTDIFGGTADGVWHRLLSEFPTGVSKEGKDLPKDFTLSQNYPNPFNPTTTIEYSLAKAGNVKLTVYNAIGSKVATIVNEYKSAGNYSVQFNGCNLASGIYFYRLESGNYNAAKKFILMK